MAYFDDVRFASVDPPVPDDVANSTPPALSATEDGGAGDDGPAAEPIVFPSLVNGGFEDVREDGTPVAPIAKLRRPYSGFRNSIEGCAPSSTGSLRRTWRGMDSVASFGADGHAGQRGAVT